MSIASRVASRYLRAGKIDAEWIKQVRKTWGQRAKIPSIDDHHDGTAFLKGLVEFIDALSEDILFNKAFFTIQEAGPRSIPQRLKDKVIQELRAIREILNEAVYHIGYSVKAIDPTSHEYRMSDGRYLDFYREKDPRSPMRAFNSAIREWVAEAVKDADKVFRRMLSAITKYMRDYDQPEIDFGQIDLKFSVGKMSVVYQDFPAAKTRGGGPLSTVPTREDGTRYPRPDEYAKQLMVAKQLLEQKGLGYLWYGNLFIQCKSCGGENHLGAHFGVGAHYFSGSDHIQVYEDPHGNLPALIIHEIGHRYYYRFMSMADRARFDSYFAGKGATPEAILRVIAKYEGIMEEEHQAMLNQVGVVKKLDVLQQLVRLYFGTMLPEDQGIVRGWLQGVPATSTYGQTISSEDFAEVFSDYVMGKDLTADQVGRFRAFLGRTRRTASAFSIWR